MELIFVLNMQTGLMLKMNIWKLGREWGEEKRQSYVNGVRLGLCYEAMPGMWQAFIQLQLGGYPGEQVFMLHEPKVPQRSSLWHHGIAQLI